MAIPVEKTDCQLWNDYFDSDKRPSHLADLSYAYHKELSPLAQRIHPAYMREKYANTNRSSCTQSA